MYTDKDVASFGKDRTARNALRRRFCKVNGVIQKLSSAVSGLATVWNTRQLRRCKHANPEQIPGQSRHRKRSGERELIHSFIQSCIQSFIHTCIHSVPHLFAHSFTHACTHSLREHGARICSFIHFISFHFIPFHFISSHFI